MNGWTDPTPAAQRRAEKQLDAARAAYYSELDTLRSRISKGAWHLFTDGVGETGLHDARLLSLCIGDGLAYQATGATPFLRNRQRSTARVEFLNFEQTYLHQIGCHGVSVAKVDYSRPTDGARGAFGDLYTYELTDGGEGRLALGFLFADGHEVHLVCQRFAYRRRRLRPQYDLGEIFR